MLFFFKVMLPGKLSVPTTSEKHFQVVEIVMHPKYKYNHAYDFALLRLDYPLADNLYGIGYNHQFRNEPIIISILCSSSTKTIYQVFNKNI